MTDHDIIEEQQREIDRLGRELTWEHKRRAKVKHLCRQRTEGADDEPYVQIGRLRELLRLVEEEVK